MNNILQSPEVFKNKKWATIIDWKLFTGMEQPIAIDDVLVLPITSFSPDVNQMGAKDSHDPWHMRNICFWEVGKMMVCQKWNNKITP